MKNLCLLAIFIIVLILNGCKPTTNYINNSTTTNIINITNISTPQFDSKGNQNLEINYDLSGSNIPDSIIVEVSFDNGKSYSPVKYASGDIGIVQPGSKKQITWNFSKEYPDNVRKNCKIRVRAKNNCSPSDGQEVNLNVENKGLIAYYPFNGNADDKSGNEHNGTVYGATITSGHSGNSQSAYDFDGVNNYISVNNGIDFSNSSFTIAFWAKRDVKGDYDCAIGQGSGVTNKSLHLGFRDAVLQYKFTFGFYNNDLDVPSQYSDLLLHFWVCCYDVSSKVRKVYRDGVLVASDISNSNYLGSGPILIGLHYLGNPSNFDGTIDDIRIYNRVLTVQEIQQLYNE